MKHVFIIKGLEEEETHIKYGEVVNVIENMFDWLSKPINIKTKRFDDRIKISVKSKKKTKEYDKVLAELKELFDKW